MATLLSLVVIGINTYFVINQVTEADLSWGPMTLISIFGACYLLFCFYLVIHMAVSMGNRTLARQPLVQKFVMGANVNGTNLENPMSYQRYDNENTINS